MSKSRSGANHPVKRRKPSGSFSFANMTSAKKRELIIIGCAVALLLAALVICLSFDLFPHTDGSLRMRGGKVADAEADWLILHKDEPEGYFHLADVAPLDGYTRGNLYNTKRDPNETSFSFEATDENVTPEIYYVAGISGAAADIALLSASKNPLVEVMEDGSYKGAVSGETATGLSFLGYIYTQEIGQASDDARKYAALYANCAYDSCILIQITDVAESMDGLMTDEEILSFAKRAYEAITPHPTH